MGIFTKDCPVCAASHPVHAVRCGCGHCFDPNKLDGVTQELEVIAQEERLYRDYLAARAAQADESWRSAKTVAAMDPSNTVKAAEALLAEQTALQARAELEAQDARAHAVGNRIKVVRSNRRSRRQAKATTQTKSATPASVREAIAPPAPKKTPQPTHFAAPQHASGNQAPPRPALIKPAPTAQAAAPQPKPIPTPAAKPVQTQPTPARVATPPRAQATPAIAHKPTPAFRNTQAAKAAHAVPTTPGSDECPNCSAKLPANAIRCRCGFELPQSASQIPSLSMSAEDQAAFLAALTPAKPKG